MYEPYHSHSYSPPFPLSLYFACYFPSHHDHSHINNLQSTNTSSDTAVQHDFSQKETRTHTSPRIHTSLHSIAIICSYGYIKKYVHQGGNLRHEMFSPFAKVRKLWAEYFSSPFSLPSMVVCTRKVTLSVNSVQHSRLSFGCHVRLNSRSPRPWT